MIVNLCCIMDPMSSAAVSAGTGSAGTGQALSSPGAVVGLSLSPSRSEEIARAFKALSDPNRVRLLSLIAASADATACVCDLTEPLGLGQPTVSHHLKILVDAGLLAREKRGVWAYYSLLPAGMDRLAGSLHEIEAGLAAG